MTGVVLDVNILISSVIAPFGFPRQIFSAWQTGRFELVTSVGIITELEEKLGFPRITRRFKSTPELAYDTITLLRDQATILVVPPEERLQVTGDPEDDYVLATCRLAQADYLVTGDKVLLSLKQYAGVKIISPRKFVELLA